MGSNPTPSAKEEYPSGLRGRFAKSLGGSNLPRGFESLLLRQSQAHFFSGFLIGYGKEVTELLQLRGIRTGGAMLSNSAKQRAGVESKLQSNLTSDSNIPPPPPITIAHLLVGYFVLLYNTLMAEEKNNIPNTVENYEPKNEPEASWSYSAGEQTVASAEPETSTPSIDSVSWTASEYVAHDKDAGWYVLVSAAVAVFAGLIYFFDGGRSLFSPILVIVAGVIFMVAANRKPSVLEYIVDNSGIHIGPKAYSYTQFKSFSIIQEGAINSIAFTPLQRFMPSLTIYYEPKDEKKIADAISEYLPHEPKTQDPIDSFMRKIRF